MVRNPLHPARYAPSFAECHSPEQCCVFVPFRVDFVSHRLAKSRWAFVYQPGGQTDDLRLLVMSRLPDTHGRSVRLNLIDVASFNPDRLTLHNGNSRSVSVDSRRPLNDRRLLNNDRLSDYGGLLNHNRLSHDCRRGLNHDRLGVIRTRQRRPDNAANHPANKSRPEVATAAPPATAVIVMVAAMPTVVMVSAVPAMRERTGRGNDKSDCYYEFLHFVSV